MEARLRKLIELRTDGPVVAEALESLSALGDVSRHALQAGLEQQSLATAEAFLAAMEPLVADVTHLDASIKTLVSTASAASARVAQVGQDSAAFLGRAAGLLQQRAALDARYAEVNNFLARYELTAEEAAAISGGPGNDTATARRFYAALERVQRLQGEALGLVTGDNQAIGLELLDHAAVQLTSAYDKLFEWALARCREAGTFNPSGYDTGGDDDEQEGGSDEEGAGGAWRWNGRRGSLSMSASEDVPPADAASSSSSRRLPPPFWSRDRPGNRHIASMAAGGPLWQIQVALVALRSGRPTYYRACQEAFASARRGGFIRGFLAAVAGAGGSGAGAGPAGGASSSGSRSLEATAHDPLRYCSGMLAWLHVNLTEESGVVEAVWGGPEALAEAVAAAARQSAEEAVAAGPSGEGDATAAGGGEEAAAPAPPAASTAPLSNADMLRAICEGVTRPLAVRIDQCISGQGSIPTVLRLADLVLFYATLLGGLLSPQATQSQAAAPLPPLTQALTACYEAALHRLTSLTALQGDKLRAAVTAFPTDLSVAPAVAATLTTVREVLDALSKALALKPEPENAAAASNGAGSFQVASLLDGLLAPLLSACRSGSLGLRLNDTCAYMLNNISAMSLALAPYASGSTGASAAAAGWSRRLAAEASQWEEALVQQGANDLLAQGGFLQKLGALRAAGGAAMPLCDAPGLSPSELLPPVTAFLAAVWPAQAAVAAGGRGGVSMPMSLLALGDKIGSSASRDRVRTAAAAVVVAAYSSFRGAVMDPASGYVAAASGGNAPAARLVEMLATRLPADLQVVLGL